MAGSPASELPPELLELIFSVGPPDLEFPEPLLSAKERLRCQLVCKAWQHALDARRWPLWQLKLEAGTSDGAPAGAPAAALWVQRVRPGIRQLEIELGAELSGGHWIDWRSPLQFDCPEVQAVHGALLALQPLGALRSLRLAAPFPVLERFLPDLGRFTGLRQLELQPSEVFHEDENGAELRGFFDDAAVLRPALLRHLPPHLGSLTATDFYSVRLDGAADGDSEAGASAAPAQLPPGLSHLHITSAYTVRLNLPLPGLAQLDVQWCSRVNLGGEQLHLPQLTSLALHGPQSAAQPRKTMLRCSAMPALAQLSTSYCCLRANDGFACLQHLTRLNLTLATGQADASMALVRSVSQSLRRLTVHISPLWEDDHAGPVARALAAAGAAELTQLEFNSLTCLSHLLAWPNLQELRLAGVQLCGYESNLTVKRVALLAAAPSLRRLAIKFSLPAWNEDAQRDRTQFIQELQLTLPGCTVEEYF